MDIGKLGKFWRPIPVALALLLILPSSTGYIDCRISCRRCHENTEHPSVLEVYCAMCDECKQRRRERMLGRSTTARTSQGIETTLIRLRGQGSAEAVAKTQEPPALHAAEQQSPQQQQQSTPQPPPPPPPPPQIPPQMPPQLPPQLSPQMSPLLPQQAPRQLPSQQLPAHAQSPMAPQSLHPSKRGHQAIQRKGYDPAVLGWPSNCPTPPICSDSSEETMKLFFPHTTTTTTTTTTTQAPTQPPCPPIMPCKKKTPMCMPCMPMCPCPMFTYPQNMMNMMVATPPPTTPVDYHYLYVGLPKNVLSS